MFKKLILSLFLFISYQFSNATLWTVDNNFQIEYQIVDNQQNIQFTFNLKNGNKGWMGIAFNSFMFPADTIIVWWDPQTNQPMVWDAYNPGIPTLPTFPAPLKDNDPMITLLGASPLDNQENVQITSATNQNGVITITVKRKMQTGDIFDYQFEPGMQLNVVAAYNKFLIFNNEMNAQQPIHTAVGSTRMVIPGNSDLEDMP